MTARPEVVEDALVARRAVGRSCGLVVVDAPTYAGRGRRRRPGRCCASPAPAPRSRSCATATGSRMRWERSGAGSWVARSGPRRAHGRPCGRDGARRPGRCSRSPSPGGVRRRRCPRCAADALRWRLAHRRRRARRGGDARRRVLDLAPRGRRGRLDGAARRAGGAGAVRPGRVPVAPRPRRDRGLRARTRRRARCRARRIPLVVAAVAVGVGFPARLLDDVNALALGPLALGAVLWALLAPGLRSVRRTAPGIAVGGIVLAVAVTAATAE